MHHAVKSSVIFPNTVKAFVQRFFKAYRLYFVIMILINVFSALCIAIQPYVLKKLIDAVIPFLGQKALIQATLLPAILLILLTIFNNLAWRLNSYVTLKSIPALKADIIDETSDYVHEHSFNFFQNNLSGAISNRIVDLANNTDTLITNYRSLFQGSLAIISAIIIAAVVNPIFSIMFLIWTLLFIIASFYISKKTEPFSNTFAESRSIAIGNVVDSFANAINVILFAHRAHEKEYLRLSLNKMVHKDIILQKKLTLYAFLMSSLTTLVQILAIVFLLYFGSRGSLTAGDFALIFMLTVSVSDNAWYFCETLFRVAEQLGIFHQALQFISTKYEIIDPPNAIPLKIKTGTIVFSRVKFFYTESQQLFEDKTLIINGREKVGLVGYSGSGKSSFVNLITRTFDIQSGDILIDDQSIQSVTLKSLRENIAFIPQDPTLFHRSLIDNIRYGKLEASDSEVMEAAKKAHVDEFASALPQGYHTLVGERGTKLSGGQRQRVAIARAILKDAPILILDEATSALDSMTELLIQKSLQVAMENKTVIVIAHRLSTIKAMDRILVFDKGHVVEEGTHDYLLAKGNIYPGLWKIQQAS